MDTLETTPPPPDVPPQIPDNPSEAELEIMYAALRKAHKGGKPISWYRQWPVKYLIAALPMWWLIDCGLVKPSDDVRAPAAGKFPPEVNQTEMAKIISQQFGIVVDKTTLSRMKGKDAQGNPLYPWIELCWNGGDNGNKAWKPEITLRLWAENMGDKKDSATEAEDRRAILKMQREQKQIELDEIKRVSDAAWIPDECYRYWGDCMGLKKDNTARDRIENHIPKMVARLVKAIVTNESERTLLLNELAVEYPKQFEEYRLEFHKYTMDADKLLWQMTEQKKAELKVKLV